MQSYALLLWTELIAEAQRLGSELALDDGRYVCAWLRPIRASLLFHFLMEFREEQWYIGFRED